jgi:thymidylate synthase (FAD)
MIKVLDKGYVEYIDHYGSDQRIVEAARVSYSGHSKGEEKDKKLLFYLYKNKHSSPFEQCKITFKIKMPLFVAGQFVRHRMQNLNFQSYRYTKPQEEFYIPTEWRRQDTKNKQSSQKETNFDPLFFDTDTMRDKYASEILEAFCERSYRIYNQMIDNGIAREMARMILPQNLYTTCYSCWDLSNLLKFIYLRDESHAQYEIQEYARAMKAIVAENFPWTMEAYEKFS